MRYRLRNRPTPFALDPMSTAMAKQSLVAKSEVPAPTAMSVPGGGAVVTDQRPVTNMSPYVSFVSLKSPVFPKIAPFYPDLQEGEPILFRGEPERPLRLEPFRFILLHAKAHWAHLADGTGEILSTTFKSDNAAGKKHLREHVEAVVFVFLPDGKLCPTRCTFKTTKTRAAWAAVRALDLARDSETWGKLSPEHLMTLAAPDPRFRYTTTCKMSFGNTSRTSGIKFSLANGIVKPTTAADWKAVTEALNDPKFCALAELCVEQWGERLADLEGKSAE